MNDITVTKGSTEWDVEYTADQAATVTKTMETGGTVLDRDIRIEVTVPTGTEGTPIATKGAVSGHSVSVTPSVTNTGGFISGSTITGAPVSVSASELVSGTKNITAAGTTDVTNYASASVSAGTTGTPTATKGTVSGNTVSVTPSVTNTAGFIAGGTLTGTPVSVSASELVNGTKSITASGTTDVTNYASASVAAGSAATPATSITANPSISVSSGGVITASVSATQSVTPSVSPGFVSAGTAGTITVSGSASENLSTQAAQTITPTTSNIVIPSGKYLTGAQTILGDANLVAGNIAQGITIFGVEGTHSGGGGDQAPEKAVNLIDYDGTILYSYTADEFAALSALPVNPVHAGLTAQGWNWTLADAQTHVSKYGYLWIGQNYITDDGKTRLYINLANPAAFTSLTFAYQGKIAVDFGDGTTPTTRSSSSYAFATINHSYSQAGQYVISIDASQATQFGLQTSSGSAVQRGAVLEKVETGTLVNVGQYGLLNCTSLKSVSMRSGAYVTGTSCLSGCTALRGIVSAWVWEAPSAFNGCTSLSRVSLANGVSNGSTSAFNNCPNLRQQVLTRTIESGRTSTIGASVYANCYALNSVIIQDGITTIGAGAFVGVALHEIHFKPTTPPTISSANAFNALASDCKIYVPAGTLSAYTSASNYPSSSTYTYIEE